MTPEQFEKFRKKHLGTRKQAAEIMGFFVNDKPNQQQIARYEQGKRRICGLVKSWIALYLENLKLKKIIEKSEK